MGSISSSADQLVYDLKLSSVVPASITGDDKRHELKDIDLALKLHYITTVHFIEKEAAEGLSIDDLKLPMFRWLELYYPICGRIRRDQADGKPYIKCNDSGVRIVEANCGHTLEEWRRRLGGDDHRWLVYSQPLAHDLEFTPLVFLQFTKFKCGGLCVGMSWAHVLGDAFSAVNCINTWGKILSGGVPPQSLMQTTTTVATVFRSMKFLDNNWKIPNTCCTLQTHTFHLTEKLVNNLLRIAYQDKSNSEKTEKQFFDVICGVLWKSLAKIKGKESEPKMITVCKKGFNHIQENELPNNENQIYGIVEAYMNIVAEADWAKLARLVSEGTQLIDKEQDFLVYGENLTFVDLEELDLYGLKVNGKEPVFASLSIQGVGNEGTVVVLPSRDGRIVNVNLPKQQLQDLKNELRVEWGIS